MRYKLLGRSGLRVSEICLGTMTFGEEWGWGSNHQESRKVFDLFAEKGGNFLDTANNYTNGTSEKMLEEFIHNDRDQFVIATKYTLSTNKHDPNASGNHRKNLNQALHASLKRLDTDYIDLLWMHAWDNMTPVEEIVRALDDVVRAGKVHYVGISDTPAWVVSQANTIAHFRGWSPFVGLQLEYSLIERTIEREFFPLAHAFDLGITAWSPLAMGLLTGKYNQKSAQENRFKANPLWASRYLTDRNLKIAETVVQIADEARASPAQVAINWVRQMGPMVIPIIGAKTVDQLKDNIGCLDFELTDEQMQRLCDASKIEKGFPYDFLEFEGAQQAIHGEMLALIDNHHAV